MSYRPLAFVSGLTVGDYVLWNWSLNANHDVIALISGLALLPLAIASAWMLAVALLRLIGSSTRRAGRAGTRASDTSRSASEAARGTRPTPGHDGSPGSSPSSSGKIAA